jgi:hypothetical protein
MNRATQRRPGLGGRAAETARSSSKLATSLDIAAKRRHWDVLEEGWEPASLPTEQAARRLGVPLVAYRKLEAGERLAELGDIRPDRGGVRRRPRGALGARPRHDGRRNAAGPGRGQRLKGLPSPLSSRRRRSQRRLNDVSNDTMARCAPARTYRRHLPTFAPSNGRSHPGPEREGEP